MCDSARRQSIGDRNMKKFSEFFITERLCIACGKTMQGFRCPDCDFTLMYGFGKYSVLYSRHYFASLKEVPKGCLLIIQEYEVM